MLSDLVQRIGLRFRSRTALAPLAAHAYAVDDDLALERIYEEMRRRAMPEHHGARAAWFFLWHRNREAIVEAQLARNLRASAPYVVEVLAFAYAAVGDWSSVRAVVRSERHATSKRVDEALVLADAWAALHLGDATFARGTARTLVTDASVSLRPIHRRSAVALFVDACTTRAERRFDEADGVLALFDPSEATSLDRALIAFRQTGDESDARDAVRTLLQHRDHDPRTFAALREVDGVRPDGNARFLEITVRGARVDADRRAREAGFLRLVTVLANDRVSALAFCRAIEDEDVAATLKISECVESVYDGKVDFCGVYGATGHIFYSEE